MKVKKDKKITRITCDIDDRSAKSLIRCLKVFKRYGFTKELSVNVSPSGKGHHVTSWSDKAKGVSLKKLIKIRRKAGDDSVSEDTLLYWKENGQLRFSKITELYKSFKEGNKIEVRTAKIREKNCMNKNLINKMTQPYTIIVWGEITDCWHRGKKEVYNVELNCGKHIEITKNHSLFGREKTVGCTNTILPMRLSDLKVVASVEKEIVDYNIEEALELLFESKLVTMFGDGPKKLYILLKDYENKEVNTRFIYKKYRAKYGAPSKNGRGEPCRGTLNTWLRWLEKTEKVTLIKQNANGWEIWKINKEISLQYKNKLRKELENILILGGLWLADGCYDHNHAIKISAGKSNDIVKFLIDLCKKRKNIYRLPVKYDISKHRKGDLRIHSFYLVKIMKNLGFVGKSTSKKIPDFVFTLPNDYIANILRGYFSGDGCLCLSHNIPVIGLTSISKELIYGTSTLLSKLGIVCSINTRIQKRGFGCEINRRIYNLSIDQRDSVKKFLNDIGFIKKYNSKKLYEVRGGKKQYELHLRKIKKIEMIGVKEVYDIEITPTESFVANGILCHNSTRCDLDTWGSGQRMINVLFTNKKRKNLKKGDVVFDEQDMQIETCGCEENVKVSFGET